MRTCPSVLRDCACCLRPGAGEPRSPRSLWAHRRPYTQNVHDFTCLDVNIDACESLGNHLCAPRSSSTKPLGQPQDCAQQTCLRVASLRSPSQGALWVSHKTVPNKTVYALLAK